MIIELALLADLATVTTYRSVPEQTDSSPFYTSIGEHVAPGGCALSRDLLKQAPYGSYLYIEGVGMCRVNDTTNKRLHNTVDLWVSTYAEEKHAGIRHRRVYKLDVPKGNYVFAR